MIRNKRDHKYPSFNNITYVEILMIKKIGKIVYYTFNYQDCKDCNDCNDCKDGAVRLFY